MLFRSEDQALLCSPETGALLDRLSGLGHLLSEMQELQIKVLQRDRERHLGVPAELQANFSRLVTKSSDVWRRAKATSDWYYFEPYLDRIITCIQCRAWYIRWWWAEEDSNFRPHGYQPCYVALVELLSVVECVELAQ